MENKMTSAQCLAICATIFAATHPRDKTPWLAAGLYFAAVVVWAGHLAPV